MVPPKGSSRSTLFLLLFLFSRFCFGSETRVDSAGGLSLVLGDETQEICPFTLGNPAGLAILDPQNRFDAAGQWFKQNDAASNSDTRVYGTLGKWFKQNDAGSSNGSQVYGRLNELGPDSMKYHGFILFPAKGWSVQGDGDFYHTENQPGLTVQDQNLDRTRELFRTAYNFGPFILGGDIEAGQANLSVKPGNFYGSPLLSGSGTSSTLAANSGFLLSFPENPRPNQNRFLLGGVFSMEVIPSKETENLVITSGPTNARVNLTQSFTEDTALSYGPEIYFQVPNAFEACLLGRITNGSNSIQIDSSDTALVPNLPAFKLEDENAFAVVGAFKAASLLFKTTSLKTGLSFVYSSGNSTYYNPNQTVSSTNSVQNWRVQAGIGMEKLLDYTVGLQVETGAISGNNTVTTAASLPINLFSYKISLGGERWITQQTAFRGGVIFKSDQNTGSFPYSLYLYPVDNGQSILSTTITAGAGFKGSNVQGDLMFWFGQPYVYNSPNPSDFKTQIGVQFAGTFFFK